MDPSMYTHRVSVARATRTVDATTGNTQTGTSAVIASLPCLIEPLSSRAIESCVGRNIQARLRITWGTQDVRDRDQVTFQGHVYVMRDRQSDTLRPDTPYQTALLAEMERKQTAGPTP